MMRELSGFNWNGTLHPNSVSTSRLAQNSNIACPIRLKIPPSRINSSECTVCPPSPSVPISGTSEKLAHISLPMPHTRADFESTDGENCPDKHFSRPSAQEGVSTRVSTKRVHPVAVSLRLDPVKRQKLTCDRNLTSISQPITSTSPKRQEQNYHVSPCRSDKSKKIGLISDFVYALGINSSV